MKRTKYQIFISSTFDDLEQERDQIIRACLELNHIPVAMEMFSAGDDSQWETIAQNIDDCDYFVVIIAHKYGSEIDEISYTEKEYDYAVLQGIPTLGFIIDPRAKWKTEYKDTEMKVVEKLNAFKEKVKSKSVTFWKNKNDLSHQCLRSLYNIFITKPRPGWIRKSDENFPQISHNYGTIMFGQGQGNEKAWEGLTAENKRLRWEIFMLKNEPLAIIKPSHLETVERIIYAEGFVNDPNAKIWPVVWPVSSSTYWVQSRAKVNADGSWRAKVIIGSVDESNIGAHFQLMIVVNPVADLKEGDELEGWPEAEFTTKVMEVIRG